MDQSERVGFSENITKPEILEQSLNDQVLVKITQAGEKVRNKYFKKIGMETPPLKRDEDGYTEMPLHEVCYIFGSELYMGNVSLPIEMRFKIKK
jgi:hypothetical protein